MKQFTFYDYTMLTATLVVVGVCLYTLYLYKMPDGAGDAMTAQAQPSNSSNSLNSSNGRNGSNQYRLGDTDSPQPSEELGVPSSSQYDDAFPGQSKQIDRIGNADDPNSPDVGSNWQKYILSQ